MALPMAQSPGLPRTETIITVKDRAKTANVTGMRVRIEGLRALQDGLKAMQVTDAPFLRAALMEIGTYLMIGMTVAAPFPSFKVGTPAITGSGAALRVRVPLVHPGSRSYEFGRKWYFRGYRRGGSMKAGVKFQAQPGQVARPFLGIITGRSVAQSIRPVAEPLLLKAFQDEWKRASAAQGGDSYEVGA